MLPPPRGTMVLWVSDSTNSWWERVAADVAPHRIAAGACALAGWQAGWLVRWLAGGLAGWLAGWQAR
jgi:hypothetical protein